MNKRAILVLVITLDFLLLAMITLKLCGIISWSWWIVFSPFYVPLIIIVAMIYIDRWRERKRKRS